MGLVSPTNVPFTSIPLGKTTFQISTSVGRSLQTYDLKRGLNLVFVTRPQTPSNITAIYAWKDRVFAAWGSRSHGEEQGIWVLQRGQKVAELGLPSDLEQPVKQLLVFGQWIVGCATTRIEIWKSATFEHYTSIHPAGANKGDNELTGGMCNMPTFLNKIMLGRRNGWVEIWNVSTAKLIYTILPPSPNFGSVTCMEPTPALSLLAVAYSKGPVIIHNVVTDRTALVVNAGGEDAPVTTISFRSDGLGAGHDGRKDGVMATATEANGDVTFWDLNKGGSITGALRSAHYPPSHDDQVARGGISKVQFLPGQAVLMTSGRDNSLKSWIFDESPFSPVPRILHSRSGHAGPVTSLQFSPTDFDGADAGNKWLLSGGRDRSLWAWSLRRDGQSSELSQGNIRKQAKKAGILANTSLHQGPTTTLDDLKAPEITCIASSLNRDGGIGALPGKQAIWQKGQTTGKKSDAEVSSMTGWESVVTGHKNDSWARTWFWGRKRAGRWALRTGDESNVSTVAITPCGTFALVGSEKGSIDMYNLQSGLHRQRYPSRLTPAQARQIKMQQLRQQTDMVSQLKIRSEIRFSPGTGKHRGAITGLVVDSLDRLVISCSLDGTVKFWDFLTGNLVHEIDWAPRVKITSCRYHPGNDLIAFSCDDRSIRVVDIDTKRKIREFSGCNGTINDFTFSHDGRWIIAASQDSTIRVWDLPTSHLIDAFRLERPCNALAFSGTGEFLAGACDGQLGVHIWTNRTLFKHVPTRQISESEIGQAAGAPTTSGEGGQGLLEAAFEDQSSADGDSDDTVAAPALDQLSEQMLTLSLVPRSKWQTLLHLDLIKRRNKPTEAPKRPEKAPFFLPSVGDAKNSLIPALESSKDAAGKGAAAPESRITKLDRMRAQEVFTTKLLDGAASGDCKYRALATAHAHMHRAFFLLFFFLFFLFFLFFFPFCHADQGPSSFTPADNEFIDHLKDLSPSTADLELRSLALGDSADDRSNEMLCFIRALTSRLVTRRDFELTQAWMAVFLRLHFDVVMQNAALLEAIGAWRTQLERERNRLDELVGYCGGVVGFLRNPRT